MNTEKLQCPCCGAPLDYNGEDVTVTVCPYCRTVIAIPKEFRTIKIPVETVQEPPPFVPTRTKENSVSALDRAFDDLMEGRLEGGGGCCGFIIGTVLIALLLFGSHESSVKSSRIVAPTLDREKYFLQQTQTAETLKTLGTEANISLTPGPEATSLASTSIVISFEDTEQGTSETTRYITVDNNGTVYTAEREGGPVQRYNYHGKFLSKWEVSDNETVINGMAANHTGKVFVAYDNMIGQYNGMTGVLLGTLKKMDTGKFGNLCITADNHLLAVWYEIHDTGDYEGELIIFDEDGNIIHSVPSFLTGKIYDTPLPKVTIAVDSSGIIHVLSYMVVSQYSLEGKAIRDFRVPGRLLDLPIAVNAIAADSQNHLYVGNGKQIAIFTKEGRYIDSVHTKGSIDMMVVDEQGRIWGVFQNNIITITLHEK